MSTEQAMEYKHTWVIDRDSRVLRTYLWAWAGDEGCVTFCKLFWGYVFLPLNLLARLVWALLRPLRWAFREDQKRTAQRKAAPAQPKEEIPGRIAEFFARPFPRRIAKMVGFIALGLGGAAAVFGLGWVLWRFGHGLLHDDKVQWVVGYLAFWAVLAVVVAWLDRRYKFDARLEARKARKRADGGVTLGDVFVQGAKAVKTNTCPKVEVRSPDSEAGA